MATIKDLFKLTTLTQDEPNRIALRLLLQALNQLDWKKLDGNLLEPLAAAYAALPETPAIQAYRSLLMKTSDYCISLQQEAEKVPFLQDAFKKLHQKHEELKKEFEALKKPVEVATAILSPQAIICNNPVVQSPHGVVTLSSGFVLNSLNQVTETKTEIKYS